MEIALGIGDILICRMRENPKIILVNRKIIRDYRNNSEEYYNFILWLIEKLFPESIILKVDKNIDIYQSKLPVLNLSLKKYFNIVPSYNFPYLIFHTKARFDYENKNYYNSYKKVLINFIENFKTDSTILLLGDKIIDYNHENLYHRVDSLYDELKKLEKKNKVIDKTRLSLQNDSSKDDFCDDISLINGATCNIGFGYGGNFVLSTAFSNKFYFFIGNLSHEYFDQIRNFNDQNYRLFNDVEDFCETLNTEYSKE